MNQESILLSKGCWQTQLANYHPTYLRLMLPAIIMALLLVADTRSIVTGVLSDAFFQVAVFVAATLAIFHGIKHLSRTRFQQWQPFFDRYQIPTAALLGALPGCGGAIIVVTQFIRGQNTFGSVVAVLTATMGDAAFVLLAAKPMDGLIIISLGMVVGTITGYCVDRLHRPDFLRPSAETVAQHIRCKPKQTGARILWQALLVPGFLIGLLMALQADLNGTLGLSDGVLEWAGAAFALLALFFWSIASQGDSYENLVSEDKKEPESHWLNDVAHDTNFILAWVITAFLVFELLVQFTGFDLGEWFTLLPVAVPLIAILVGLLPGCGPQIIATTLYIQGHIPFSAQLGNALSNDGDALFPAIALAPKAALVATLYSSVPAFIAAYSYFFLFE